MYPGGLVQDKLIAPTAPWSPHLWTVYLLNPLTPIVSGFQRALYRPVDRRTAIRGAARREHRAGSPASSAIVLVVSLLLLLYTWRLFFRLSGDFAEEL